MTASSLVLRRASASLIALSFLTATGTAQTSPAYELTMTYEGPSFGDHFNFITGPDPEGGFANYVDEATAANNGMYTYTGGTIRLTPNMRDGFPTDGPGRNSVRLESIETFDKGLIVTDLRRMPGGTCGTWPHYGTVSASGAIFDIIEGVNSQANNLASLHTTETCSIPSGMSGTSTVLSTDCTDTTINHTLGCIAQDPSTLSYGSNFNTAGGGIYATEISSSSIKTWFFSRASTIPEDITDGNPDPDTWGEANAVFDTSCSIESNFMEMRIFFDVSLCGPVGGPEWSSDPTCKSKGNTCVDFVAGNAAYFTGKSWFISSVKLYQRADAPAASSTVPAAASSSAVDFSDSSTLIRNVLPILSSLAAQSSSEAAISNAAQSSAAQSSAAPSSTIPSGSFAAVSSLAPFLNSTAKASAAISTSAMVSFAAAASSASYANGSSSAALSISVAMSSAAMSSAARSSGIALNSTTLSSAAQSLATQSSSSLPSALQSLTAVSSSQSAALLSSFTTTSSSAPFSNSTAQSSSMISSYAAQSSTAPSSGTQPSSSVPYTNSTAQSSSRLSNSASASSAAQSSRAQSSSMITSSSFLSSFATASSSVHNFSRTAQSSIMQSSSSSGAAQPSAALSSRAQSSSIISNSNVTPSFAASSSMHNANSTAQSSIMPLSSGSPLGSAQSLAAQSSGIPSSPTFRSSNTTSIAASSSIPPYTNSTSSASSSNTVVSSNSLSYSSAQSSRFQSFASQSGSPSSISSFGALTTSNSQTSTTEIQPSTPSSSFRALSPGFQTSLASSSGGSNSTIQQSNTNIASASTSSTAISSPSTLPFDFATSAGVYKEIGCYADPNSNGGPLNNPNEEIYTSNSTATTSVQTCLNTCAAGDYKYTGYESGYCFCSNVLAPASPVPCGVGFSRKRQVAGTVVVYQLVTAAISSSISRPVQSASISASGSGVVPSSSVVVSGSSSIPSSISSMGITSTMSASVSISGSSDIQSGSGSSVISSSGLVSSNIGPGNASLTMSISASGSTNSMSTPTQTSSFNARISPMTSRIMTTSTVYTTTEYTITSCAATVTDCPAQIGQVTTETIALYTTVCPVTEQGTTPNSAPLPTQIRNVVPGYTISTVYITTVYTITSCAPSVTDCPARMGSVTTEVIPAYTTIIPQGAVYTTVLSTTYVDICPTCAAGTSTYTTTITMTVPLSTNTAPNPIGQTVQSPTIPMTVTEKIATIQGSTTTVTCTVPAVQTTQNVAPAMLMGGIGTEVVQIQAVSTSINNAAGSASSPSIPANGDNTPVQNNAGNTLVPGSTNGNGFNGAGVPIPSSTENTSPVYTGAATVMGWSFGAGVIGVLGAVFVL